MVQIRSTPSWMNEAVSALVNIDPYFRLTMFSVTLPLKYEKIRYIVGDSYIPKDLLKKKRQDNVATTNGCIHPAVSSIQREQIQNACSSNGEGNSLNPQNQVLCLLNSPSFLSTKQSIAFTAENFSKCKESQIRLPPQAEDDTVVMILEKAGS